MLKASSVCWVMFASDSHPNFAQRAFSSRLSETSPVVMLERPLSVVRSPAAAAWSRRTQPLNTATESWSHRSLYFPEKLPVVGKWMRGLNAVLLRRTLDRLCPARAGRVVCYDSPSQWPLVGTLREAKKIYLAIDDRTVTLAGHPIPGALTAEKHLLDCVDEVVCVSNHLKQTLASRIPGRRQVPIHIVSNGYNDRLFDPSSQYARPSAYSVLPPTARIVLVTGHISDRIDWRGVEGAVHHRPEWTWVFVGPMDDAAKPEIDAIHARHGTSRLVVLPAVEAAEIPAYIAHAEICAIPYRLNDFTQASSPLKGLEYLAMGAPVISTRVPSLTPFGNGIQWVDEATGESYAAAIDRIIAESDASRAAEERRRLVRLESWTEKTRQLTDIVFRPGESDA